MKFKETIGLLGVCALLSVFMACETSDNSNANVKSGNANTYSNRNAMATPTPVSTTNNSNISRDEYDKNRAQYEKDKGSSTIGQGIDDSWLWFKTRTALAAENDLRDSTINVDCVNAAITLKGTVATASQKTRADAVAKGIDGVKTVRNDLQVKPNDSMTNEMVNGNSKPANKHN